MKNRIKKDMLTAMKEKNAVARDILRVLKGEIERNEQSKDGKIELSDAEIVKLVKKLIENGTTDEIKVLEAYLPQQMNHSEICQIVVTHIATQRLTSVRDMGKVMTYFKQNFDGTYDGKELSAIVREILNK